MKLKNNHFLLYQSKCTLLLALTLQSEVLAGSARSSIAQDKPSQSVQQDRSIINKDWAEKQEKARSLALLEKKEKENQRQKAEQERALLLKEKGEKEKTKSETRHERQLDARRAAPSRMSMIGTFCMGILSCIAVIAIVAGMGTNTV